ncbi:hypothetical protein [Asticcacaulis taihuensis]|uniref:hypothetical protein n=1 Tax=Asticcacaulis taihuensis TaxID=260084 RepID=UPI003F7CB30A
MDDLALRRQALKLRLAAQAEKLVGHIEGLDEPTTPLEAERMARALKAADAAIEQIFKDEDETSDEPEEEDMNDDTSDHAWRVELERKLIDLAHRRRNSRVGVASRQPGERREDLGVLGERPSEGADGGLA